MVFFDRTAETHAERKMLGDTNGTMQADDFILNVGVLRPDGMGVTVSELAGPDDKSRLASLKPRMRKRRSALPKR